MFEPVALWTGLDLIWVKVIIGITALFILKWGRRNPWRVLQVSLIVALLGGAAYAALELSKTGTSTKASMYSKQGYK